MKQKVLALLILFMAITGIALAQPSKGQFYTGGSLSYSYDTYGSKTTYNYTNGYTDYYLTKVTAFSISPEFGYFISNKLSVSIQPTYQHNSGTESSYFYSYVTSADNNVSSDTYKTNVAGVGINLRYYLMLSDKFGFFPQLGVSTLNNTTYFKYGTFNVGVSPNFVFFPSHKIGINFGFGNIAYSLDYATKNHSINAALNNNITFGLNYFW
ncbi:MAG: hypothetical protein JWP45_1696 [Mucilaginibacter sp.]|jgi:hypothetical protein|nr:hypothetical protein [Mucilaginibacter sp.]MDB5138409.1 hypothetical protein [Mucilaginibacter sp.]